MTAEPTEAAYDGYATDYREWWAPVIAPAAVSLLDRLEEEWLVHRFTPQSYLDVAEHWTEDDAFADLDEPTRVQLRSEVLRRLELIDPEALVWRRPLVSVIGRKPSRR